jgi:hypothetical protein
MARKLDGSYITANTITTTQLQTTVVTQIQAGGGPKVTTITYPNSATAAVNTGNESVVLTGTGFDAGVQVYINGAAAPAVSRTNSTSLSFTTPALTTGTTYPLYVVNPDGGTAVVVPGMVVSAGPVWVTASPLDQWNKDSALSRTLVATSDSTVSYSLADGSSLPAGLSLAANGLLSGTLTSPPAAQTTYNFTVTATDLETQKSSKAFSINATAGIVATGGTVSNIAGYRVHTFTSSGTFDVQGGTGTVEYLVVAGGGGGGTNGAGGGGGGGAGGYRFGSGFSVTPGTAYTVTVGAGGAGGATNAFGANGSDSIFSTITSTGGGAGAGNGQQTGRNGGSGGGGSAGGNGGENGPGGTGNTPSTSPSQGNNGGTGVSQSGAGYAGGGGGGAGGAGGASMNSQPRAPGTGGDGGDGSASSITGTSVTRAGGGGGGGNNLGGGSAGGNGGTGGGGAGGHGQNSPSGAAGTTNTGGGGGGKYNPGPGNSGGSGIVIIRYAA